MSISTQTGGVLSESIGDGPTRELFAILNGNFNGNAVIIQEYSQDNITATASGNQTNGFQLVGDINRITTVANPADSVVLPASKPGYGVIVTNHGANACQVYGLGSDTINDVAAATGVSQMVMSTTMYVCFTAGKWYTLGLAVGESGSFQTNSFQDAMTANSGGVQTGATAITTMIARFTTVGGAGYSSVLPAAAGGMTLIVINAAASNSMNVFPAGTDAINLLGASVAYSLPAGSIMTLSCTVAGQWHAMVSRPSVLPSQQYTTNTTTGTFLQGQLTGADEVYYNSTAATPGTINVRTAAQMFADTPNAFIGQTYGLRIINTSANVLTVGQSGGSVTLTGTMTLAANTFRDFVVTFNSATTATIQQVGTGTTS